MRRAIELRAQPFVRIEHNAVRALDAGPQAAVFRTDHGRPRPSGIDVQIQIFGPSDRDSGGDVVTRAGAGAAGARDDARGNEPRRPVRLDRIGQGGGVHPT